MILWVSSDVQLFVERAASPEGQLVAVLADLMAGKSTDVDMEGLGVSRLGIRVA